MGKIVRLAAGIVCVLATFILVSRADNQNLAGTNDSKNIIVEIDYGGVRPSRTVEVPRVKDRTVLEVLQGISEVKTHPVGDYVFVTSIDGVEGKRGEMAWYYTINGTSADKLAYTNVLNSDTGNIKWVYKKDVCSCKVDGKADIGDEGGE